MKRLSFVLALVLVLSLSVGASLETGSMAHTKVIQMQVHGASSMLRSILKMVKS